MGVWGEEGVDVGGKVSGGIHSQSACIFVRVVAEADRDCLVKLSSNYYVSCGMAIRPFLDTVLCAAATIEALLRRLVRCMHRIPTSIKPGCRTTDAQPRGLDDVRAVSVLRL